ncbi:hypothetical protein SARC_02299 [Sphaeroforma arctica JP610]|uniref:Gp5/Type VI secretion system Vgr C-terminal trimerisation domain-containing protein n=1 Tax=Sphaeroforma arctica JP610 TaxID=667725 RepID=A0A0L0GBA8_9EUKA|nr:hypothetical protein SARC_02299 [Sphaeroforma arctica JP610]KNC85538.1 hypothetical protein SARC_02299 [Sphaeroforma arctica JP610]|eukprot:XP_014159440.1 hypothetical protein SARC_02299 [Sphaeroforma arctica JP610]
MWFMSNCAHSNRTVRTKEELRTDSTEMLKSELRSLTQQRREESESLRTIRTAEHFGILSVVTETRLTVSQSLSEAQNHTLTVADSLTLLTVAVHTPQSAVHTYSHRLTDSLSHSHYPASVHSPQFHTPQSTVTDSRPRTNSLTVSVSQSHSLTVSQSHSLTVSQSHSLTVSQSHSLTVSQSHSLTVAQSHSLTVSQSHSRTVSQSHSLTVAQSHDF